MLAPRESTSREHRRLDGLWDFALDRDGRGRAEHWERGPLPGARPMPVPASWNDLVTDRDEREHAGEVWYQREVRVPRASAGRRTVLRLDAATHAATVWVDGTEVARHEGGYTPFEAEVTGLVHGRETVRVTVCVDNRLSLHTIPPGVLVEEEGRPPRQVWFHDFENYSGLHRPVWLLTTPTAYVADVVVRTGLAGGAGTVAYDVTTVGEGRTSVRLLDADGAQVAAQEGASGELVVPGAVPWRPGAAYLYTLEVRHGEDVYPLAVGIRTVRVEGARLLVNDEPVELHGFGMHEDVALRGKGHDDARMVRDFALLRWIGANSFRTSHYPYAEEVLDLADREGVLVISETAAVGLHLSLMTGVTIRGESTFGPGAIDEVTQRAHLQAVRELVERDRNHPCVIAWSIANEPDTRVPEARDYFAPLFAEARRLDPTRPVTFANVAGAGPDVCTVSGLADLLCLNRYYGWYVDQGDLAAAEAHLEAELRAWRAAYDKPVLLSELGADAVAGLHSLHARMWSEEYQRELLAMTLRVLRRVDGVIGEHVWNFADFATAQQFHRVVGNRKGVFTRDREPKQVAHWLREQWRGGYSGGWPQA
ncbi:beta-glucuronidase [Motilibacter rhizosphaerae]|uniref:Beta-glucuronidase n=1 Tax=Motilibacter rhizosphaerae TaxID=598652 RepID=A0A4Q7NU89_9ACTN|nr:beta-glucuronidase [Motilibacter rhizosphaerae]RZS89992.1 beta-glucuronidase [Motilibacter rhizosphaerae]